MRPTGRCGKWGGGGGGPGGGGGGGGGGGEWVAQADGTWNYDESSKID